MAAIAWPTSGFPNPMSFRISPLERVVGSEENPYTGARTILHRWHKWHLLMRWNHTVYGDLLGLMGHFNQGRGGIGIFQVPLLFYRTQRGTRSGSVTLSGAHAAGATSLTLAGGSGTLLRGDWIQIFHSTDVPYAYNVVSSETAGVIKINPGLRLAHSGGTAVYHLASVAGGTIKDTMELADPEFAESMPAPAPGQFQPFALELVTALRVSP
jgi:hypothetical protein